jgi:hypothetical protein
VPTGGPTRFVDPAKVRTERLEQLRAILNGGTTIFITHPGASISMSSDKADSLVDRVVGGKRLDSKEGSLPKDLQDQLRHPVPLVHLK